MRTPTGTAPDWSTGMNSVGLASVTAKNAISSTPTTTMHPSSPLIRLVTFPATRATARVARFRCADGLLTARCLPWKARSDAATARPSRTTASVAGSTIGVNCSGHIFVVGVMDASGSPPCASDGPGASRSGCLSFQGRIHDEPSCIGAVATIPRTPPLSLLLKRRMRCLCEVDKISLPRI